uniref:Cadherin domain-containing protein n=1 Tax=Echinococcus canadensis TaxID=519352 RepID=A0A915EZP6_9CEST
MFALTWTVFIIPLISCEAPYMHQFYIKENTPAGTLIGQLIVQHQKMFTSLAGQPLSEYILIHPTNGSMLAIQTIDREAICQNDKTTNSSLALHQFESPSCEVAFLVHITTNEESLLETVQLTIIDMNDNSPIFEPSSVTISVPESSPIGGLFYLPPAKDADLGKNGISSYHLSRIHSDSGPQACPSYTANDDGYFTLSMTDENTPQLRQISGLDYEKFQNLFYCLHAYDGGGLTSALLVAVEIQDVNDNSPQWVGLPYHVRLRECAQQPQQSLWKTSAELRSFLRLSGFAYDTPFRFLIQLAAIDADSKENGLIKFKVVQRKADIQASYKVVVHGDKVYIIGQLDYETTPKFSIAVEAKDGGGLTNVTNIDVTLEDCNDNTPKITVTSLSPLPRENLSDWSYYKLTDIWISEEDRREIKLATITVSDADTGENAAVSCDIEWNNLVCTNPFSLVPLKTPAAAIKVPTVFMLLKRDGIKFDREVTSRVQVTIVCADRGHPQANIARQMVDIGVWDINDNAPKFKHRGDIGVQENEPDGTVAGYVHASDIDFGRNAALKYSIKNCKHNVSTLSFTIDERTGKISTLRSLDRENKAVYCVTVEAVDEGDPQLGSSVDVNITVLDVNDSPPVFQGNKNESGRIVFEIPESFDQERLMERFIGQVNATDADSGANGTLEFSIKQTPGLFWHGNPPAYFRITRKGQLYVDGVLDREKQQEHEFTVVVSDTGAFHQRLTSEIGVTIRLQDQNDNSPVFTEPDALSKGPHAGPATLNTTHDVTVNSSILRICAKDNDLEENGKLNFTLRCAKYLRPYFGIGSVEEVEDNEKCTNLIVKKPLTEMFLGNDFKHARTQTEHQIYVTVMDLGYHPFSKTARIRIFIHYDPPLNVSTLFGRNLNQSNDSGIVAKNAWTHRTEDVKRSQLTMEQVFSLNKTVHSKLAFDSTSSLGHAKAKYLFIVAVVIFAMFVVVLGLLAFLFIRDFPFKRQAVRHTSTEEREINSHPYSTCQAVPIVYAADYPQGNVSLSKFQLSVKRGATASEGDSSPPQSMLQLTSSDTSRIINGSQQDLQFREFKPSESGLNFSETEEGSIPTTENTGSNGQAMPNHITQNHMSQSPLCERSNALIVKYAAPPIYAPLHPRKAILLGNISPCQERRVMTTQSADNHNYGLLPTTLVLSEINETYTALNNPTQRKQAINQAVEFNGV